MTLRTIAEKLAEGFDAQGWQIIGRGGSWGPALRPLEAYINSKIARAVKEEREACAQILDRNADVCANNSMIRDVLKGNAAAIRARSQK